MRFPDPQLSAFRRLATLALRHLPHTHPAYRILWSSTVCHTDWFVFLDDLEYRFHPAGCGNRFCPSCARDWSDDLRSRLTPVATSIRPRRLRHLVLTVVSAPSGKLSEYLSQMMTCFRLWKDAGRRGTTRSRTNDAIKTNAFLKPVSGITSKIEVTWSEKGWHPHLHCLLDASRFDCEKGDPARETWTTITGNHMAKPATVVDVRRCDDNIAASAECAKYCMKPFSPKQFTPERLAELCVATFHRRLTASSGTLHIPTLPDHSHGCEYIGTIRALANIYSSTHSGKLERNVAHAALRAFQRRYSSNPDAVAGLPDYILNM